MKGEKNISKIKDPFSSNLLKVLNHKCKISINPKFKKDEGNYTLVYHNPVLKKQISKTDGKNAN